MNRAIKFRAIKDDISNYNFVYGQLVYDAIGTPRITAIDKSGAGLTFHTCLKNTECQYTGLKDKNGIEIYSGDIMKDKFGAICKIVYVDEFASFKQLSKIGYSPLNQSGIITDNDTVIGNIYQNPELLNIK